MIRHSTIQRTIFILLGFVACHTHCCKAQNSTTPAQAATTEVKKVSFKSQIAPVLQANCVSCHCAKKAEGGFRLDNFHELTQAGDSDSAIIVAGKAEEGLLWQRISSTDPSSRMPPESEPLAAEQLQSIRQWIAEGAEFDGSDSKQPLALVSPPVRYQAPPAKYATVPVTAVCFSPDGNQVVAGGYHELTVWDAAQGTLIRRITNIGQRVYAIAFSSDGKMIAVACGEPGRVGEVRLLDWGSGEVSSVPARTIDVVLDVAFRPGRDELGVAAADHSVRIINYKTGQQLRAYSSHADWVTAIAFSADGNKLASSSRDKSAKVYELETGQMLVNYAGHASPVRGVAFTADGAHVLSVGDDKKLHRWTVTEAKKVAELGLESEAFRLVRIDNNLFVPCASRKVLKVDLSSNKTALALAGSNDWTLSCAIAADGRIAAGTASGIIKLWSADGKELTTWTATP